MQKLIETKQTLSITGYSLHYRVLGSGTPLVLIHGYGVSGRVWQPTLRYLAQQHQVFVVDLPGHGYSTYVNPWRLRAIAPLLAAWLRQLHLPPVALLGQSTGGSIAIHLAASAPELVRRLILVSSTGVPLQAGLLRLTIRSVYSFFQPGNGTYPPALIRDILIPRPRLFWQAAREVACSDFRAELTSITMPTLIIWGKHDALIPISIGYALEAALPHARFVILPNCGHRPMLAEPEAFSKIVLEFLEEEV
jgi:pimeloyl-ACP methyl ester carboxylesterase